MKINLYRLVVVTGFCLSLFSTSVQALGFETVSEGDWDKRAVAKVLHAFAFKGFASDKQIKKWAKMAPDLAVAEMLTFNPVNSRLSNPDVTIFENTATYNGSLEQLQDYWSSENPDNPVQPPYRERYSLTSTNSVGEIVLPGWHLQLTWTHAMNIRGVNPFLHKVAMYLTNYHMAISIAKTQTIQMRDYYDNVITALSNNSTLFSILAQGATSAAVARAYGHQYNRFAGERFIGNDDFAREFHQLFFKIQGLSEDPNYHEDITIEHTAWVLTGMRLDRVRNYYGTTSPGYWFISPINFTDHQDDFGDQINNISNHYHAGADCLEILHQFICGATAKEKITNLAQVAGFHPESLQNLPVYIIDFFADDNLSDDKKSAIREAWKTNSNKDLLSFLRDYAVSKIFHDDSTVKYRSAFDRHLIIANAITGSNAESFARFENTFGQMAAEGAKIFDPAHDVFGGQTGLQAANNPNIFKDAYINNVKYSQRLGKTSKNYTDTNGDTQVWIKNWAESIPANGDGEYIVKEVAEWLWQHFLGDGRENYGNFEKAYLEALLAQGTDLGYQIDPANAEQNYSEDELDSDLVKPIIKTNEIILMSLNSADPIERKEANRRVGLAVNFITITPYMFALEGK